jgi:hypothetical protein
VTASTAELAATSAARPGPAASAVNTTRLVVRKPFAINRMDTLLNRSPDGDAQQRPPLPVMRRSEGEIGSIGVCYVFAAVGPSSAAQFSEAGPA